MAGYVIAEVQVTDPERYAEYREQVNAGILAYGGRFLARGGKAEALEGDATRSAFDQCSPPHRSTQTRSSNGRRKGKMMRRLRPRPARVRPC